jgi:hypothetical protein
MWNAWKLIEAEGSIMRTRRGSTHDIVHTPTFLNTFIFVWKKEETENI